MNNLRIDLISTIPGLIVSKPESAIYLVLDFKKITNNNFEVTKFIDYCATIGKCKIDNKSFTLLLAPMNGFYSDYNMGKTQARIAIVEKGDSIKKVPKILSKLIKDFSDYSKLN